MTVPPPLSSYKTFYPNSELSAKMFTARVRILHLHSRPGECPGCGQRDESFPKLKPQQED